MATADAKARVALITGGASGISLATAERLLASGWKVAIVDREGQRKQHGSREMEAMFARPNRESTCRAGQLAGGTPLDGPRCRKPTGLKANCSDGAAKR